MRTAVIEVEERPEKREAHTMILYNDTIILFGGRITSTNRQKTFLNDVWLFDLMTKQWRCLYEKSEPSDGSRPVRRQNHTCIVFKNTTMILYGGQTDNEQYLDDTWEFDLVNHKWQQIETKNTPAARHSHTAILWNDSMIIFGGRDGHKNAHYSSDAYEYNINTKEWNLLPCRGTLPQGRSYHKASLLHTGNHMLIFGGYFWNGKETYYNDIHVLDLQERAWVRIKVTNTAPPVRNRHLQLVVPCNNKQETSIFVHGGNWLDYSKGADIFHKDAYILSAVENKTFKCTWNKIDLQGLPTVGNHSAVYYPSDQLVYMFGGECSRVRFNDMYTIEL
jgi:N-acetylneuraminic acid mutarotase